MKVEATAEARAEARVRVKAIVKAETYIAYYNGCLKLPVDIICFYLSGNHHDLLVQVISMLSPSLLKLNNMNNN